VKIEEYQWQSDFALEHQSIGRTEGRTEGRAEGRAEGEAKAVLLVLQARKVCVSQEARERITGCTDLEQLERWLERAATVDTLDELFA
jgi:predicted transposase YdaD